jgi:hypothetical protein
MIVSSVGQNTDLRASPWKTRAIWAERKANRLGIRNITAELFS